MRLTTHRVVFRSSRNHTWSSADANTCQHHGSRTTPSLASECARPSSRDVTTWRTKLRSSSSYSGDPGFGCPKEYESKAHDPRQELLMAFAHWFQEDCRVPSEEKAARLKLSSGHPLNILSPGGDVHGALRTCSSRCFKLYGAR
eukprot:s2682_g9.t1